MTCERRLLITNCLAGFGGGEIAVLRHLDHSAVPRDQLTVALLNDGPLIQAVRARGVRCENVGRPNRDGSFPGRGETVQIAWRLARLIRRGGVRYVFCYTVQDLRAALIARRFCRFQLFWRSQGELTVNLRPGDHDPALAALVRAGRNRIDGIFSTTAREEDFLVAHGMPEERVRTVYYGVDEAWFEPRPPAAGITLRVVLSGRLVPWKGHATFLRAFAQASGGFPEAEAWIVGGGDPDYQRSLEDEASRLGVRDRVRFWGHRDDVRDLVRQCDVAVHCSDREPFGLVIIEAMASGLPVLASDVEGPPEIICHGKTGFLAPPGDVSAFADVLRRLLADGELRRRIGEAGRAEVINRFRALENTAALEDVLFANAEC
jgi:glycosyltransferase involved in cell wall biosynthesis